jgi:hypothetical protein
MEIPIISIQKESQTRSSEKHMLTVTSGTHGTESHDFVPENQFVNRYFY